MGPLSSASEFTFRSYIDICLFVLVDRNVKKKNEAAAVPSYGNNHKLRQHFEVQCSQQIYSWGINVYVQWVHNFWVS